MFVINLHVYIYIYTAVRLCLVSTFSRHLRTRRDETFLGLIIITLGYYRTRLVRAYISAYITMNLHTLC